MTVLAVDLHGLTARQLRLRFEKATSRADRRDLYEAWFREECRLGRAPDGLRGRR